MCRVFLRPRGSRAVINQLLEISNFIRTFRVKTRFGRWSREPLQLIRLEWDRQSVVCEWLARRNDSFDQGLPKSLVERNESTQALEDALTVRDLLFALLPDISSIDLRVYRQSPSHSLDLVIAGTATREDRDLKTRSLAMRVKLCGLHFMLDDGRLVAMRVAHAPVGDVRRVMRNEA
jgi:hypothetical protein